MNSESEIEEFFQKIETMMTGLEDFNTQKNIEKLFTQVKSLIDELEETNELCFGYYRFIFHNKNAAYLKVMGKQKESLSQEKLCKKFQKEYENYKKSSKKKNKIEENKKTNEDEKKNFVFKVSFNDDIEEDIISENSSQKIIEISLSNLNNFISDDIIKKIFECFQTIEKIPQNFFQYQMFLDIPNYFHNLYNEYLLQLDDGQNEAKPDKQKLEEFSKNLENVNLIFKKKYYQTQIKFIQNALIDPNIEPKLFDNVAMTVDQINKRYRELSALFHPDKTSKWLLDKHKSDGRDFFKLIFNIKDRLMKTFSINANLGVLENNAETYWNLALDYRTGYKKEWEKLRSLEKNFILEHNQEELSQMSKYYAKQAYEEYRSCCKVVDKQKNLAKQIQLRESISLCLYFL